MDTDQPANTGAYTHYVYGPNYVQSYSTVNTVAANFLQADSYAIQVFDGAGRVIGAANNHPGSFGEYRLVNTIYDLMGRAAKVSNPGEINNSWVPVGDEAVGLTYTQQTYDWKGRPLVTTHLADGTQKYASYTACGCAGSEVVTLTDEVGRQQRVSSDSLGRQWKTETLNDGGAYSTYVNVYNARDQVTNVKQYSGAAPGDASSTNPAASCPTGTCQESSAAFDGYGRLQSKHASDQDAGTATTYSYNNNDTLNSVTDARGASATYAYYNNRGLINGISYNAPSGVANTSNVSFTYDAAGDRTSMSDGTGLMSYSYDSLSRLSSETKTFNRLSGSFTLSYDYNLANEVKSVTDQRSGASFSSIYDNIGRVTSVSGVGYGGAVTQFASQIQYRAWGALKSASYGNNTSVSLNYNARGLVSTYAEAAVGTAYQYWADGRIKFAADQSSNPQAIKDRAYQYDHAGRIAEAYSGAQARDFLNNTNSGVVDGPFRQTYSYDAWDNVLNESGRFWSRPVTTTSSYNSSNRNTAWSYDADGNVTSGNDGTTIFQAAQYGYDAAGETVSSGQSSTYFSASDGGWINHVTSNSQNYDGDGELATCEKAKTYVFTEPVIRDREVRL